MTVALNYYNGDLECLAQTMSDTEEMPTNLPGVCAGAAALAVSVKLLPFRPLVCPGCGVFYH